MQDIVLKNKTAPAFLNGAVAWKRKAPSKELERAYTY